MYGQHCRKWQCLPEWSHCRTFGEMTKHLTEKKPFFKKKQIFQNLRGGSETGYKSYKVKI